VGIRQSVLEVLRIPTRSVFSRIAASPQKNLRTNSCGLNEFGNDRLAMLDLKSMTTEFWKSWIIALTVVYRKQIVRKTIADINKNLRIFWILRDLGKGFINLKSIIDM